MQFNHIVFGNQIIVSSILRAGLFQGVIGIIGQVCLYGSHSCYRETALSTCLLSLSTQLGAMFSSLHHLSGMYTCLR